MRRFYTLLLAVLLASGACSLTGCATKQVRPATAPGGAAAAIDGLRSDLERVFSDPSFATAQWGVVIVSLDNGEVIFEKNATRLYMPASNNKLLTAAAALATLGADYTYKTQVLADGQVAGGALNGDLVIVGSGDPTMAARFLDGDVFAGFKSWAATLKQKGITRINGNLVGDDGAFEQPALGAGWEWDDLANGYAAPVTALQFNENVMSLEVTPATEAGKPALVMLRPFADFVPVSGAITTAEAGTEPDIEISRPDGTEVLEVGGSVPLNSEPVKRGVAVRDPALFFLRALRNTLEAEGIAVSGSEKVIRKSAPTGCTPLWTHTSVPMSEIAKPLLKISQNLYAETLARTVGLVLKGEGSFAKGREAAEEVLRRMGVEPGTYSYADGSGLSRRNLLSADLLVRLFRYVYRQPYFTAFYEALPIAGVDGTIAGRMKGTRAENNVRAKTGTLTYVRSLSGYVRTADGEMLAFSMIANNFLVSSAAAEYVQDRALERLAAFTRTGFGPGPSRSSTSQRFRSLARR